MKQTQAERLAWYRVRATGIGLIETLAGLPRDALVIALAKAHPATIDPAAWTEAERAHRRAVLAYARIVAPTSGRRRKVPPP